MSNFVVSARKYRPQRFDEVVGQQHVSQTLKNALQNDHLAHAFLFCGPRGVGKTTCARILAKTLNCQNPTSDFEPCNVCDNCKAFASNASFNITELDAASNNSVEHIRALIEQVRFQPQQGKYKVFIIDEVHMLSQQAFNAFLKTLEEPPPYAIFILATTEKHKIIPTILSRCQIFDFKRIQGPDIVAHLADICQQEGITADTDALHIIAQKADGALRDALSIFDRIVAFSGKQITYEDVITNLNVLDYDYYFRVVEALLTESVQQTLLIFDDIQRKGFDGDLFMTGLAQHLRNLLVCKDQQTLALLDVGDSLRGRYQQQASLCGSDFLLTTLNLANTCDLDYKFARNKRLHVEMCLIKMASVGRAFRLADTPLTIATPEKKTLDGSPADNIVSTLAITPPTPPQVSTPEVVSVSAVEESPVPSIVSDGEAVVTELPTPSPPTVAPPPQAIAATEEAADHATERVSDQEQGEPPHATEAVPGAAAEPILPPSNTPNSANSLAKADVSSLLAQIKAENEVVVETVSQLDQETVQAAWDAYATAVERDSLRFQLQKTKLEVAGLLVTAKVSSSLVEGAIRSESGLTEALRTELRAPDLLLRVEVDASLRPKEQKIERPKTLSARDKDIAMVEQNPAVKDLVKKFELRPDE
ncbi:MAG: DNA polymerase III subunit gamma/tau [Bacteroidota bacterium]